MSCEIFSKIINSKSICIVTLNVVDNNNMRRQSQDFILNTNKNISIPRLNIVSDTINNINSDSGNSYSSISKFDITNSISFSSSYIPELYASTSVPCSL